MYKKFLQYLLIGVLIINAGCKKETTESSERSTIPVVSAKAISQDVPEYIDTIGCCRSYASVDIIPQVYGTLQSVHFEQGSYVKKGDLLYVIDPTKYEAILEQAQAKLVQAEAQFTVDSAQLERSKSLLPQKYISKQEYEALEAQVLQDKASIEAAKANIKQAKYDFANCFITSPIDGVVGKYLVDIGNVLSQTNFGSTVLVNIQDIDRLYVDFSVSENVFSQLYKNFLESSDGLDVIISLASKEEISITGKLKFIENSINKRSGSIELRAVLDNKEHKFWPGITVDTKVLLKINKGAVLVPTESVRLGQLGHYVFVIKEDKTVDLRNIKIGQQYGDFTLIKEGVNSGESVVQTGQLMLAPGMKVAEVPDQRENKFKLKLQYDQNMAEKNPTTK